VPRPLHPDADYGQEAFDDPSIYPPQEVLNRCEQIEDLGGDDAVGGSAADKGQGAVREAEEDQAEYNRSSGGAEMARVKLSEDLRPLSDLETQASEVVQQAHTTGRPVVLTREGRGVAVLLSVEAFEDLQSSSERLELQRAVDEAERDIAEGNWVEGSEVVAKLKRWSAGEA